MTKSQTEGKGIKIVKCKKFKPDRARIKKLNSLIDEMFFVERFGLEYGSSHKNKDEIRLCRHKAKFLKIVNDLIDQATTL